MKNKCPSQFSNTYIGLVVLVLLLIGNSPANAQGVIHLNQGDSYVLSQPTFTDIQIDENGAIYVVILVGFSGNLLTLGESMQADILSSPTSLTPLATGNVTNSTVTPATGEGFDWLRQPWIFGWDPANGAVRLTMLSGGVDIFGVSVTTWHDFSKRSYSYTIPEPSVPLLLTPGLVYLVLRRRKI